MKQKKSQVQSQVFIYIFGIVVVSLILIFGVKAIYDFSKGTEKVSFVHFQNNLKAAVASVASEYDTVRSVEVLLPSDFKEVCFTDKNTTSLSIEAEEASTGQKYPLIKDSVSAGLSDNVFVIKSANDVEQFKTESIVISNANHFLCIDNMNGKITLRLRGKNRYAELLQ